MKLMTISGIKAVKRYYLRRKVNDYNDLTYVCITCVGAVLGILLMGFILY